MSELNGLIAIDVEASPEAIGCSCPMCATSKGDLQRMTPHDGPGMGPGGFGGPIDSSGPGLFELLDITQAPDGTWFFSGNRDIDSALIGSRWTVTNITYSFPTSGDPYGDNYDIGQADRHVEFNAMQKAAAQAAFSMISSYTNLTFTEITEDNDTHAILRLSQTLDADVASAMGYFPGPDFRSGDIWFGRTSQPYYDTPQAGNWGFSTILHEIGHTMGLKHGHQDYTLQDLSIYFGGGGPRAGSQSTPAHHDGQAWTLMSYRSNPGATTDFSGEAFNQPQTYMQNDIAALQYMYGANYSTNNTDTTYTWSETTGEMFINGAGQGLATSNTILMTLWDGGGEDTFDLQNYDNGVVVDLRPGGFSTFSQDQLANHRAFQSEIAMAPGNVGMALLFEGNTASLIENVIGGDGNDWLIGNQLANELRGGIGDDVLEGSEGNDLLDGGASGSDTAVFYSNTGGVTVVLNNGVADLIVANDGFTDTLRSIENVIGGEGNDNLTGDDADNLLDGGALGNDTMSGGVGDDTLIASGHILNPIDSPDLTKAQALSNDSIPNAFVIANSDYDLVEDEFIANSTTMPHATVNATAFGGVHEFYRIDVLAGDQIIIDIDTSTTSTLDSWIDLLNSGGTSIANNDTGFSGDPGGFGNDDAMITFTFATAGTYYIKVGQWTVVNPPSSLPLTAGQTYTMNVSLTSGSALFDPPTVGSADMDGGVGDDLLIAGIGDDDIAGGADDDTVSYQTAVGGVDVSLGLQGSAQDTGTAGMDNLSGIENLIGSGFNDNLTGDGLANVIEGGAGDDSLNGMGGHDTLTYEHATAGVMISLTTPGAQATGGAGSDTVAGFEDLVGSAFDDNLTGDTATNVVTGGEGNDVLNGGGQSGVKDTLSGGGGIDVASFAGAAYAAGVLIALNDGADVVATDLGSTELALLQSIEGIEGSSGADLIIGDSMANVLRGGAGNDFLDGFTGNDTMEGGANDDTIAGGADIDTIVFTGGGAITLDLGNTVAGQATGYGTDLISGFENVVTGSGTDNITGNGDDNVFYDNGGNDTYNGAGGSDTLDYTSRTAAVSVNLNTVAGQNTGGGGTDTITNMENVVGTAFNDTFTGQGGAGSTITSNRFIGGLGHDQIQGNTGNDHIEGGDGSDLLAGDVLNALSTIDGLNPADGSDTIIGGIGNDIIISGLGNDLVDAGLGNDTIVQGIGNGTRTASGSTLTAIFANFGGFDTIEGGEGFDTCYLFYGGQAGDLVVDISNPLQTNFITLGGSAAGQLSNVERILARGGLGNDTMTGGISADQLFGNEGNDSLNGGEGNDTLFSGLDNDAFIGGQGIDTLSFASSLTGVTASLAAGTATGEGTDTISGVEYLVASGFTDHLIGSDVFNIINDTGAGAAGTPGGSDWYEGLGGNDTLQVTRGTGHTSSAIILDGGAGHDIMTLSSAARTVSAVAQTDTAQMIGGGGNDTISVSGAGIASSTIDGGNGNDLITVGLSAGAGLANHTITGGAGTDQFILTGGGVNGGSLGRSGVITDFEAKNAGDRFEWTTFMNGSLTGYTAGANAFSTGHLRLIQVGAALVLQIDRDGTAGGVNSYVDLFSITDGVAKGFTSFNLDGMIANDMNLVGTAAADTVKGSDGNDTLSTGLHVDLLEGGAGADSMDGGLQNDTATYEYATAAVTVDAGLAGAQDTGWGMDTLVSIEHLIGSAFGDTLTGGAGYSRLDGGLGDDDLAGMAGDDRLFGGEGNDTLRGGADDDRLDGGDNSDTVTYAGVATAMVVNLDAGTATGEGTDTLVKVEHVIGGDGADDIVGSGKANMLNGGAQDDLLSGLAGADVLQGAAGGDTLDGGRGADTLTGGSDADTFAFDDLDSATDRIADLEASDVIDLSAIDANLNKPGNPGFILVGAFSGVRGQATLSYDGVGTTTLAMDRNGDSVADLLIEMDGDHTGHTNFVGLTI